MSTQTTTTITTTQQQEQQESFQLTKRIVPWKVPKLTTDGDSKREDAMPDSSKTFFPLNVVGLAAPPVIIPVILLLLSWNREIPIQDHAFSIGFALYLCAANKFRFDTNSEQLAIAKANGQALPDKFKSDFSNESWFDKYMASAAIVGLVLPLLIQVFAPIEMANATAPHLYVLFFQILMEVMGNGPNFHPMLWMVVPIGYSAYRTALLKTWLVVAWQMLVDNSGSNANAWAVAHFGVALINVIFWTYNTFVMLLLRVLPSCLDKENFPEAKVSWKYHLVPVVANQQKSHTD